MESYEKELERNKDSALQVLRDMRASLKEQGITRITAPYNGSGDEGFLEKPVFYKGEEELTGGVFEISGEITKRVEGAFELILGSQYPGWGDNDGSTGEIVFNVEENTVEVDHSWYVTEKQADPKTFKI